MIAENKDRERERQRIKQATAAAAERDIVLSVPADLKRRKGCLDDPFEYLRTYFRNIFSQPFTADRKAMVESIIHAASYSGDYALAGPRGEGKTKLALFTASWLDLKKILKLPIIVGKNQAGSENELENLKIELTSPGSLFSQDFPEICEPLIALDGWASRARKQTVQGYHSNIGWQKDCIFLPTIPLEALPAKWPVSEPPLACGQGLAVVGIDGKIRGFNRRNIRPDLAIIDDIDDRESARSITQTADHCDAIDKDVAGLSGSGGRCARVMLCTVINSTCVAALYTEKAGWRGQRYKMLVKLPASAALWEQYIELRKQRTKDDPDARVAHNLYLSNRKAMEEGAEVSNPYAFEGKPAADGEPLEVSTLQACYNKIADIGWEAFCCEYQNDPQDSDDANDGQITSAIVASRISGLEYQELPTDCERIVAFFDVGEVLSVWTDAAWRGQCIGSVLDYGWFDVKGGPYNPVTKMRDPVTLQLGIIKVLHQWRDQLLGKYRDRDDQPRMIDMALIDSGDGQHTKAVYQFCREVGPPFFPSKGQKDGWRIPKEAKAKGDRWALVKQPCGMLLYEFESTYWKQFCHHRFLTPAFDENNQPRAGSLSLFVLPNATEFSKERRNYTHQIVGEVWGAKTQGAKPGWIKKGMNHMLDCTAGNCLAANIVGVRLLADAPKTRLAPEDRPSARQLAGK